MYKFDDIYPLIIDELNNNRNVTIRIHGTSMKPLLKDNTKVLLTKVNDINKNDIIFFKRDNGEYVIHRVVKTNENTYTFMGDHQLIEESNIRFDQCFAKAIGYYKNDKLRLFKGFKYKLYLITLKSKLIRRLYTRC